MAQLVYALCALTSIACAALLLRHYRATRGRLLFWSAGCFLCFAITNILLFVDLVLLPEQIDLTAIRHSITLTGSFMLLAALIWDAG